MLQYKFTLFTSYIFLRIIILLLSRQFLSAYDVTNKKGADKCNARHYSRIRGLTEEKQFERRDWGARVLRIAGKVKNEDAEWGGEVKKCMSLSDYTYCDVVYIDH